MTHLLYDIAHVEIRRARYAARRKIHDKDAAHVHNLSGLCLSEIEEDLDLPQAVMTEFETAIRTRDKLKAVSAFWLYNAPHVKLAKADTRLFVDPPPGLVVPEGDVVTLKTLDESGEYGKVIKSIEDPLIVRQVGYSFAEVDLFSPPCNLTSAVYARTKPGTVIAVFDMSRRNNFWMSFVDLSRATLTAPKELGLELIRVFSDEVSGDVELNVFGVEASA